MTFRVTIEEKSGHAQCSRTREIKADTQKVAIIEALIGHIPAFQGGIVTVSAVPVAR